MIYSIEKAQLITKQLKKFKSAYVHHVVGYFANLDFWLQEVKDALQVLDNHKKRFKLMKAAQQNWIENHEVVVHDYCPICMGKCEFSDGKPTLPNLKIMLKLPKPEKIWLMLPIIFYYEDLK